MYIYTYIYTWRVFTFVRLCTTLKLFEWIFCGDLGVRVNMYMYKIHICTYIYMYMYDPVCVKHMNIFVFL